MLALQLLPWPAALDCDRVRLNHGLAFSLSMTFSENRCPLFGIMLYANRIDDSRLRPAIVASSVGPQASKNCTSCLRAPSSFHLRSRLTMLIKFSSASDRRPLPLSAS